MRLVVGVLKDCQVWNGGKTCCMLWQYHCLVCICCLMMDPSWTKCALHQSWKHTPSPEADPHLASYIIKLPKLVFVVLGSGGSA